MGDAVVFRYNGAGYAEHVGIVTAINTDGTINYTSGNTGNPAPNGADGVFTKTITPSKRWRLGLRLTDLLIATPTAERDPGCAAEAPATASAAPSAGT